MSSPQGPHNQQHNQATGGGSIYANQGGNQSINHHQYNTYTNAPQKRTGRAILAIVAVDIVFFLYGMTAYTGRADDSGDLWRAGIFLVLLAITGSLIRRWFRQRL